MKENAEELLERGMAKLEEAMGLMEEGAWGDSVQEVYMAARLHIVAVLHDANVKEKSKSLTRLLQLLEAETEGSLPASLTERSFRLDRMYVFVKRNLAASLGWRDYPDEELCAEMLHISRTIIKYCRGRINRANSCSMPGHEESLQ